MSQEAQRAKDEQCHFWQLVWEAHGQSGLSVAAFCRQEGLSEAAYYYWRRKLQAAVGSKAPEQEVSGEAARQQQCEALEKVGVRTKVRKRQVAGAGSFLEVTLPEDHCPVMELVLCSGNTLRIPSGVDSGALGNIILVLRQAGLC